MRKLKQQPTVTLTEEEQSDIYRAVRKAVMLSSPEEAPGLQRRCSLLMNSQRMTLAQVEELRGRLKPLADSDPVIPAGLAHLDRAHELLTKEG